MQPLSCTIEQQESLKEYWPHIAGNFYHLLESKEAKKNLPRDDIKYEEIDCYLSNNLTLCAKVEELSLRGIKQIFPQLNNFTGLTKLDLSSIHIERIDPLLFQSLTSLKYLRIENSGLTHLDVINLRALETLSVANNPLVNLNLSNCSSLIELYIDYSINDVDADPRLKLSSLDVTNCTGLKMIAVEGNKLTSLDLRTCRVLERVLADYNCLTNLDITGLTALRIVSVSFNQLTSLDLRSCSALRTFSCYQNSITHVDATGLKALRNLFIGNNPIQLSGLKAKGCESLESLDVPIWDKQIKTIIG